MITGLALNVQRSEQPPAGYMRYIRFHSSIHSFIKISSGLSLSGIMLLWDLSRVDFPKPATTVLLYAIPGSLFSVREPSRLLYGVLVNLFKP